MSRRPKPLCLLVLSAPQMFGFMAGQSRRLSEMGFEPVVVSSSSATLDRRAADEGAGRIEIPICREISPILDVLTFVSLCRVFFRHRPAAVLLSGPKAIFLGGMAAWLMGVERRVAVYHGMRQEVMRGPKRVLLDLCDRVAFACADRVLAVSPSLRDLVLARGLCQEQKISVTGNGTANGIDAARYDLTPEVSAAAEALRIDLGIADGVPVIGFVGRLTEDKGLAQLFLVHAEIRRTCPDAVLLLVGEEEVHTASGRAMLAAAKADPGVRSVGAVEDVRPYLALMQVLVFPSLREGFPIAPMEAASMQVPAVGFPSTGVVDAIVHGRTGMLCPPGDTAAMSAEVLRYLHDAPRRAEHGLSARQRVLERFTPGHIWRAYQEALGLVA